MGEKENDVTNISCFHILFICQFRQQRILMQIWNVKRITMFRFEKNAKNVTGGIQFKFDDEHILFTR